MCFTSFLQNFEASLIIVFTVWSMKEYMLILLLLNMFYEEWKEILLLWEQGKILNGYSKLPSRPHSLWESQHLIALWG